MSWKKVLGVGFFVCYGCSTRAEVVPDSWNGVESNEEEKSVRMCGYDSRLGHVWVTPDTKQLKSKSVQTMPC